MADQQITLYRTQTPRFTNIEETYKNSYSYLQIQAVQILHTVEHLKAAAKVERNAADLAPIVGILIARMQRTSTSEFD